MEGQKQTAKGQSCLIEFQNHLLHVSQPQPGKISINFEEMSKNLKHEITNYELSKINYKTVVSSLKGQHPNILSANLEKNPDEIFVLTIKVSYEFLPETVENIIFDKREISPEESEQIALKNMRNYLQNIKEQVSSITNMYSVSGNIDDSLNPFQILVKIPYPETIFTFGLNLIHPHTNNLKCQFYLYNSQNQERKNMKSIPDQGLFLNHNNDSCYMEIRFLANSQQQYDHAILSLNNQWKGTYLVYMQKVDKA